ncbi:MAG: undecaprenyl diphosphate synthase family protein [Candidatus Niyogibacteria bacterium]|nr:undecaprenyl diphosphate synthase family protein [Candidatus Niyogibacteria bacterium]
MRKAQTVVIILDGNRRWKKRNALSQLSGHEKGAENVEPIAEAALHYGVRHLVLWGLSLDNVRNRDSAELNALYRIFEEYFRKLATSPLLTEYDVCVRAVGFWTEVFPSATQREIENVVRLTESHRGRMLTFLLAHDGVMRGLNADLLIRTGEPFADRAMGHLSGMEVSALDKNTIVKFTAYHWPAFSSEDLLSIFQDFETMESRSGA